LGIAGIGAFGVKNFPEPSTFALAGLGTAALLIFRRRQKHRLSHQGATHSFRTTSFQNL
jgi:hypothetical protein